MKNYRVKEIFYSLAGEGFYVGRPTVFVRFSGCNLWSGREEDRKEAQCSFCDTDFRGDDGPSGGQYSAAQLLAAIVVLWPKDSPAQPYVVFTGGEPSLQLDEDLLKICKESGWETGIETNGSRKLPEGIDWVCVSPKGNVPLQVFDGDELKLVYPQSEIKPEDVEHLAFRHFYLQPLWSQDKAHWKGASEFCLRHPHWKLSLQIHKILGLP